MKRKEIPLIFFFLLFFCITSPLAQALRVKQIHPETGILTLDDSRQVQLAGLRLSPAAYKSLAVLFSNQEIETDDEKALLNPVPSVYLSVKTLEIPFPFKPNASPRGSKVAVNEMLISLGLAAVDEEKVFKKKDIYLKLQEEARKLGKGMWSEEPSVKKK